MFKTSSTFVVLKIPSIGWCKFPFVGEYHRGILYHVRKTHSHSPCSSLTTPKNIRHLAGCQSTRSGRAWIATPWLRRCWRVSTIPPVPVGLDLACWSAFNGRMRCSALLTDAASGGPWWSNVCFHHEPFIVPDRIWNSSIWHQLISRSLDSDWYFKKGTGSLQNYWRWNRYWSFIQGPVTEVACCWAS